MPRYTATIRHHSVSRAPVIDCGDSLADAKLKATREFGDGFLDHTIIIRDRDAQDEIVARRRIGERHWTE